MSRRSALSMPGRLPLAAHLAGARRVPGGASAGPAHARASWLLALAALAVGGVLCAPALAASADSAMAGPQVTGYAGALEAGGQGQPATIVIDSISPDIAVPGKHVILSGWVRNNTRTALQGLQVQLWSSGVHFTERGQFDAYVSGSYRINTRVPGATVRLPATIAGGRSARWRVSFLPSLIGIRTFGVYPLAAAVWDATGTQIAVERTFLPFWAGWAALSQPLKIAWLWPLIDQPHQGMCGPMLDNELAASLGAGRLDGLLQVGRRYAATAKLTWAVDPALLDDADAMTRTYRVLQGTHCWQSTRKPASAQAQNWLATLRTVTASRPVFVTPYADADVAALSHRGLDADLRAALRAGSAIAAHFLDRPDSMTLWPPGGTSDAGVVDNLVAAGGSIQSGSVQGGIKTLILDSAMMEPGNPALFYTPSAVAKIHTGLGRTVRVLLADHELTSLLRQASASSAPRSAGAVTAASQRFLAETELIAAEAPNLPRSTVVAPPRRWDPGVALASKLLADTVSAPWLRPASLDKLHPTVTPPGVPAPELSPLPDNQVTGELTHRYLTRVRDLETRVRLFASILSRPATAYPMAIARLESSAWRGTGQARGTALVRQTETYLGEQERMVAIIPSSQVTLGGNRGTVPVSIENRLSQPVRIRLQATVSATRAVPAGPRLTLTSGPQKVITIGPHLKETARLQVRARSPGLAEIHLRLLNAAGVPLPGSDRILKIRSTAFGTLTLVILAVALGVFVLTTAARVIRRGLREGRTGTVVAEGNQTDDHGLAEAPDELADARGGARPEAST